MCYLKNNLDDLRPLFQCLVLSDSEFVKDLPEMYKKIDDSDDDTDDSDDDTDDSDDDTDDSDDDTDDSDDDTDDSDDDTDDSDKDSVNCVYIEKINLYKDDNWKKCKKMIKKNIFQKYSANEIFKKLECRCIDGNDEPCLHIQKMTTDDIINIKNTH
ncbi:hypothetical protein [Acanthamoeba polyphaga mimivirus]|uniref:Uncharacterized protein n=1 Tax=Acanthamoeba polyphaga mimivirus TaxID=212035 RepID=A0A0G2XZN9_MIMIV|nr:hypothetical protein [Acanthamoeba polyphaga mimivirus]